MSQAGRAGARAGLIPPPLSWIKNVVKESKSKIKEQKVCELACPSQLTESRQDPDFVSIANQKKVRAERRGGVSS